MKSSVPGVGAEDLKASHVLWEDSERVFRKASRDEPGGARRPVLIVFPAGEHSTTASFDRLAHEHGLKDLLDARWAVRPLDLVRERGRAMLVLDDPGAEPLQRLLGSPMELPEFLRLAEALAAALRGMHERGLIHKDVNPSNVLVNATTGQVWLTGFGIASRLPRERQAPSPPEFIAGTLAYMAPEQTGRMNRSIDLRSDLYALGVVFYQMLTGTLPFTASDPMGWVHCHIARTPVPPHERLRTIPVPVSRLVMKLLAKTAEGRYQTAAGVERDLQRCRGAWEAQGRIDAFPLAEHDAPDRLLVPEKLYGREREVAVLVDTFRRVVATGRPELVLVSGYSGIGKSSVVHELHRVLVPPRGLFAAGKFDQYMRDTPYATVAQAFQWLVRQILGKSEAELSDWRHALREAVGSNGQLIVDLIPELALVIGDQPPVADLAPQDAQRRFRTVLRRFIGVFAQPEHPLALFLDDLQWIDAATLDLLEDLLTHGEVRHLLLIGAYRDNEVEAAHPLMRKLDTIRRTGAAVHDITLPPLSYDDLEQLIADSLRTDPKRARPFVQLVHQKTGGNPFFAIQFLHALADEALLAFDHANARWSWDLEQIHARRYTDNVVDLMVVKLTRLPGETQATLRQLACVGSRAPFALLETVCQTSREGLHDSLWEAVRSGLVLRAEDHYAFQHDRIQEAAYSLIPEALRAEAHLRIGRQLLAHTPPETRDEIIFEIVGQLNRGAALISSRDEREQLAGLNLIAGKRAKNAAAYTSAMTYFTEGRALLAKDCWKRQYSLAFEFELYRAECEFLTGDLASAEARLSMLAGRAADLIDQAAVTCLRVDLYIILVRPDYAVEVGLEHLRQAGVELSPHPRDEEVQQELGRIWQRLGTRRIEDLIDLPPMRDAGRRATIEVMNKLMLSALYQDQRLHNLLGTYMVNFSIEHGNSAASCVAYAWFGRMLAFEFGDYRAARHFGQLSLDLVDKPGLDAFKARVYFIFGTGISSWAQHLRFGRVFLSRAFDEANKIGDLPYIGYCYSNIVGNLVSSGEPLPDVDRMAVEGLHFAQRTGAGIVIAFLLGQLRLIRSLRGLPCNVESFDGEPFDAGKFERYLGAHANLAITADMYWSRRLQALVVEGDHASALEAATRAKNFLRVMAPNIEHAEYRFYAALAQAGSIETVDSGRTGQELAHLATLAAHYEQLQTWAKDCPENFESRAALVGAEMARLDGRDLDAQRLYEQAIRSARANGFIHNEALACETAARFYAARGFEDIAEMYLMRARDGYRRWGADGKVRQLDAHYPGLATAGSRGRASETALPDQRLDVAAIVKASQALSSEMLLPRLIERLMTIALQNAGADRGLLILPDQDGYRIEAEARSEGEAIVLRYGAADASPAPETIIRYVMRTEESVILDDAIKQSLFSEDPYLALRQPRSIFCLPLLRQAALSGVLYLENTLASHVFTAERARLLELLASQAAISLENTRLYADLQEREARVRRLFDANIIGIFTWNLDGRIIEANEAFLRIIGYDSDDLLSGGMRWKDLMPDNWDPANDLIMEEMLSTTVASPFEAEYLRKDGGRVPVLVGAALFDGIPNEGVAFVVDLTDRKQAEELASESERRYHEIRMELVHANRVATMGQLSASIAHELNQPLSGAVVNAETALLWLSEGKPNIAEAQKALARVVRDGKRASEVFQRIRALIKKAPTQKDRLDVNDVVREIAGLTHSEAAANGVHVQTRLCEPLPLILGDRVQLQQVVLNLVMNALEAIKGADAGPREILISTATMEAGEVLVSVQDSGPGFDPADVERIFKAFYTTKEEGLGMGLSICRSIVEDHGGRLWATTGTSRGAVFQFTVPADGEEHPRY